MVQVWYLLECMKRRQTYTVINFTGVIKDEISGGCSTHVLDVNYLQIFVAKSDGSCLYMTGQPTTRRKMGYEDVGWIHLAQIKVELRLVWTQ